MKILIDIIGWIGSVMVIAAYGLNSYQKIKSDSLVFLLLNMVGGVFLIIYSVYYTAYANTFINVVWVIIAIPAIVQLIRKKK
ncbi:MAG TPA: hypothetical protein PLV21_09690 [Cyclobacteriaceae bacterium]|nr:hypothetical protein [Cyclobacteriaceae bacterium]HRJ82144.1 hypothetical protein [Cyclobacteriaceae bacterium]